MVRIVSGVLILLLAASAHAQSQPQFLYCVGGLDPARKLYLTEIFVADHSEVNAIGAAFREFVEAHYGYTIPFPQRNPCKEFKVVELAHKEKQREIQESRKLDSKVVETSWVWHPPTPCSEPGATAALGCTRNE
jgi:hypothetical protein